MEGNAMESRCDAKLSTASSGGQRGARFKKAEWVRSSPHAKSSEADSGRDREQKTMIERVIEYSIGSLLRLVAARGVAAVLGVLRQRSTPQWTAGPRNQREPGHVSPTGWAKPRDRRPGELPVSEAPRDGRRPHRPLVVRVQLLDETIILRTRHRLSNSPASEFSKKLDEVRGSTLPSRG